MTKKGKSYIRRDDFHSGRSLMQLFAGNHSNLLGNIILISRQQVAALIL